MYVNIVICITIYWQKHPPREISDSSILLISEKETELSTDPAVCRATGNWSV
jgi:hypothetical protein